MAREVRYWVTDRQTHTTTTVTLAVNVRRGLVSTGHFLQVGVSSSLFECYSAYTWHAPTTILPGQLWVCSLLLARMMVNCVILAAVYTCKCEMRE